MYRLSVVLCWVMATMMGTASAFVAPTSPIASTIGASSSLSMMDPTIASSLTETVTAVTSGSGMLLAETEAWVQPTAAVLGV